MSFWKKYSELQLHQVAMHEFREHCEKSVFNFNVLLGIYPYKIIQTSEKILPSFNFSDNGDEVWTNKGFLICETDNWITVQDLVQKDKDNPKVEAHCCTIPKSIILSVFEAYDPIGAMLSNNKDNIMNKIGVDAEGRIFDKVTGKNISFNMNEEE